jgi:hypothetical protein
MANSDTFLSGIFTMYNSFVRLNIDQKIDILERAVITKIKKENSNLRE